MSISIAPPHVEGSIVTVTAGSKKDPVTYQTDVSTMERIGPLFYSKDPRSPFHTAPQKRELLRRYIGFLTPEHIQRYLVDFVANHLPCSLRRVYSLLTNFCRKHVQTTTYQIRRRDLMTGKDVQVTVVLWQEYDRYLKVQPRRISDCFQRRKRCADHDQSDHQDIILCCIRPGEYIVTAPVQIVFLQMIHSIQLLDHIPKWLPAIIADQKETRARTDAARALCRLENRKYQRRALNPTKLSSGAPVMGFGS